MIILNETSFTIAPLAGQLGYPGRSMTLIAKGTFDLHHGAVATAAEEAEYTSGDVYYEGDDEQLGPCRYESDFAYYKPRADLLLVGTCHAPTPDTRECTVAFRVGQTGHTLRVIGDRIWDQGALIGPEPFERMEIRGDFAFGGPDSEANPVGKGTNFLRREGRVVQALPNLEDPRDPVTSPRSRPAPAFFGPHGRMWQRRAGMTGTYNRKWQNERWPWFPEDFDWGHFNAALPSLQVEGFLQGDEELELRNLNAEHAIYQSALPGLRIRAFVNQLASNGEMSFSEVPMNLDTVWVDSDQERLIILWRGIHRVDSQELEDVQHIFVGSERLTESPAAAELWRARFDARLEEIENPSELEEEVEEPEPIEDEAPADVDAVEEETDDSEAQLDETIADMEAQLAALGLDADQLIAKMTADGEVLVAEQEDEEEDADSPTGEPQPWSRERVIEAHEAGDDLTGAELSGLDLSGLALAGIDLSQATLDGVSLAGSDLSGAVLAGASLNGANLSHANLEEANLAGARGQQLTMASAALNGADLAETSFPGVDLTEASLVAASFESANLPGAVLDRCDASKADFSSANLERSFLREAVLLATDLSDANVSQCRFYDAKMQGAVLEGAVAQGADFGGADLCRLRASEGAVFAGASFLGASGPDSIWAGSDLSGCRLRGVDFHGADFTASILTGADLHAANLREARLLKADLRGAVLSYVDLFRADLERADASEADLRGSNLFEASLFQTLLQNTRLEGANLGKTLLARDR